MIRYPDWLLLPDPISERCRCGQHPRCWTLARALRVFARLAP